MQYDVRSAKESGAEGVFFGIPRKKMATLTSSEHSRGACPAYAGDFHRAFDMSRNRYEALEEIIQAGVDRALTSGEQQKAEAGIAALAKLVRVAGDRIIIMAGSGINVGHIIAETRVREVHASLKTLASSPYAVPQQKLSMGAIPGREYQRLWCLKIK